MRKLQKEVWRQLVFWLALFLGLTLSYCFNMNYDNVGYLAFQQDSARLAQSALYYGWAGQPHTRYGLLLRNNQLEGYPPPEGYPVDGDQLLIAQNDWTQQHLRPGLSFYFWDGLDARVTETSPVDEGKGLLVTFDRDLSDYFAVPTSDIQALIPHDGDTVVGPFAFSPYKSQLGLQGHVLQLVGRIFSFLPFFVLNKLANWGCAALLAAVLTGICFLLQRLYHNRILSILFYATFMFSPYLINFARNIYWVPFTWFLPMLVGLAWCCWPQKRRLFAVLAFFLVLIKCLCGFEYITAVLVGMMLFPFCEAVVHRPWDRRQWAGLVVLGTAGCAGLFIALLALGVLLADGSLLTGLQQVWQLAAERTLWPAETAGGPSHGGNINSVKILLDYLRLFSRSSKEIILGVRSNGFRALPVVCLMIFAVEAFQKRIDQRKWILYLTSFAAAASWFMLAKTHSYIHIGINDVLWYLGYIQMTFYIILSFIRAELLGVDAQKTHIRQK